MRIKAIKTVAGICFVFNVLCAALGIRAIYFGCSSAVKHDLGETIKELRSEQEVADKIGLAPGKLKYYKSSLDVLINASGLIEDGRDSQKSAGLIILIISLISGAGFLICFYQIKLAGSCTQNPAVLNDPMTN